MQLCCPHEFLHICISPHLHQLFTVVDNIPEFSAMAAPILTLLAVVVESLQACDWPTLWLCDPVPVLLCVCQLVSASRFSNDFSCIVREQATLVLDQLVQLLSRHADNVPCMSYSMMCVYFYTFCLQVLTASENLICCLKVFFINKYDW